MTPAPISIIVMGVSGSGKSTIGRLTASILGCPYLEGDDFHSPENVDKMQNGIPLEDEDRWPWLDHLGSTIRLTGRSSGLVVSSCSALKRVYRNRLRQASSGVTAFAYLQARREDLEDRMRDRKDHYMPACLLDSQISTLEPPTSDEVAYSFNAGEPAERIARQVTDWISSLTKDHRAIA